MKVITQFDSSSSQWDRDEKRNRLYLQVQEQYMNHVLRTRGHVFLNEVFDVLDIPRTPDGQRLGWLYPKDSHISFGASFDDDKNVYELIFNVSEEEIWDKI